MHKLIVSALFLALSGLIGSAAFANGNGGGGGGGHGGGGGSAAGGGHLGGASSMSTNSNGVHSVDRDKGLARAEDRRNRHSTIKRYSKKHARIVH